ncbi:signal recognition particle 19 kDa protein [Stegastes partitus]|uniref:Signal recognition particle 19 kDa protein n=1 Tax=Stegastes partitus TaxID=144197 RepID=A0A9Y4U1S0_9TELE|nr:PREDICTED: signal recognition particle 19 kDa protein [Stegastes partitus]
MDSFILTSVVMRLMLHIVLVLLSWNKVKPAVCVQAVENPSCAEIRDVLTAAGMNVYVENKMHPREWNRDVQFRGRVRVQMKQADGSFCQEKFASRKDVMFYVAEMIPKLKTRTQKSGGGDTSSQQGEGGKKSKKKKK